MQFVRVGSHFRLFAAKSAGPNGRIHEYLHDCQTSSGDIALTLMRKFLFVIDLAERLKNCLLPEALDVFFQRNSNGLFFGAMIAKRLGGQDQLIVQCEICGHDTSEEIY